MKREEYLERLHSQIISIVKEIAEICGKHGLRYYLAEGSLLGAVRHNGFIPWDDDVDIAMPRADYDRFVGRCGEELGSRFYLDWITTNPSYHHEFAKVCIKGTEFVESVSESSSVSYGIFVDVFPLDESTGCTDDTRKRKDRIRLCNRILSAKYHNEKASLPKKALLRMIPAAIIKRYMLRVLKGHQNKGCKYYTNYGSAYSIEKETFLAEDYGDGVAASFEGLDIRIPNNYGQMLSTIYGDDYMELPPLEKRTTHHPLRVKFSDGTVVTDIEG